MADVKEITPPGGDDNNDDGLSLLDDDPNVPIEVPEDVDDPEVPSEETEETTEDETSEETETEEETPEEEEETPKEFEISDKDLTPRDKQIVDGLNKKDKTILKEFPEIRSALYEQKEFRRVFTSIDDAKEAAERSEILDVLEESVLSGDPTQFIEQVSGLDKEAAEKFSTNFLPTIHKLNPQLYDKILNPLVKNMLYTAMTHGKKTGNVNLERSAKHLHQLYFDDPNVTPGKMNEPEDPKLRQEREQFHLERQNTFRTDVQKNAIAVMTARIEKMIPKDVKPTLKKILVDSVLKGIGKQLNKDEYYGRQVATLYRKAAKNSYAGEWGPRIQSLYLGQANKLLPAVYGLASKEILGNRAQNPNPKPKPKAGPVVSQAKNSKDPWKPDPKTGKKMTDEEFLAS
jgi:hypothetical protein